MSQKIKLTHKKFYDKWIYKVSIRVPGISIIRSIGLVETLDFCDGPNPNKRDYSIYQKAWDNRDQIKSLALFLQQYSNQTYFKRIETNILDLYTNDKNFYDTVYNNFEKNVLYRSEPKYLDVSSNTDANSIVVKKYPHNRYKHKVFLLPHKLKFDTNSKKKFIDWVKNQSPRITCSEAVEEWFIKTDWNWDRRYVLVEDEKTLLMLKLRNSDVVGRVYNYVLSDK